MDIPRAAGSESAMRPGLTVGELLPPLVSRTDRGTFPWRSPARGSLVVVFLQSEDRPAHRTYLDELSTAAPDLTSWGARILVIMPGGNGSIQTPEGGAPPVTVVTEMDAEAARTGIGSGEDAIIIADRWGQVYYIARTTTTQELPDPGEIEGWLRYLATQCPECGVPDQPM